MTKERYPVRDLTLEADYDHAVDRCVKALRSTGAKIFELVREDDDQVVIYAIRESGNFWSRFTPNGISVDEIMIVISREEIDKCLIHAESSIEDKSNGGIFYVTKFLEQLTKRN